ncbi:MAG: tyrosine-type recombinase/integrase [Anaerolineaceae bacterium]|nr:tyrosine-type recombinase/integrase [Anaerolineaceae bacterium]
MKKLKFSQAIEGFDLACRSRHLSLHTLADYQNTYRKLQAFLDKDPPFEKIDKDILEKFLAAQTHVSNKTVSNYHIGLSALWTWAVTQNIVSGNPLHSIERPKAGKPDIIPFTEADVRAILAAIKQSKVYVRPGKRAGAHTLPQADRNRAIVLTLLDTGMRASELCERFIKDVDLRNQDKTITIIGGKGDKDRHVPISARTAQSIWKYLATRPGSRLSEPLFATDSGRHIERNNLGNMLSAAGERAGVPDVHPHRFRHTFAINFLRNGGNIYALQAILGHETLEMCLRYLKIAQVDLDDAHRRASPVDNWQL